jgi:hypothetical protein
MWSMGLVFGPQRRSFIFNYFSYKTNYFLFYCVRTTVICYDFMSWRNSFLVFQFNEMFIFFNFKDSI